MSASILFVCSGNTCRSPLAAALARREGVDAESAGVDAVEGQEAPANAISAAAAMGLDLSTHHARSVDEAMMAGADVVYTMTAEQAEILRTRWPDHAAKVHRLDPSVDIVDPYGGSMDRYVATRDAIAVALGPRLHQS
jgi:protein-tyrosine phosphatase